MSSVAFSDVNRRFSILEELEHTVSCLHAALERIADGRTVLRVDAPTFFLLSLGLERYLKVGVHIILHQRNGSFADFGTMKKYGHEILSLETALLGLESPDVRMSAMTREDLDFVKSDLLLRRLLECLDAFACGERYFLLDGASGKPMDPDSSPRARWEDILELASDRNPALFLDTDRARQVVGARVIGRVQRYLRCIAQGVFYSTSDLSRSLASGMSVFFDLRDDALEVPVKPM